MQALDERIASITSSSAMGDVPTMYSLFTPGTEEMVAARSTVESASTQGMDNLPAKNDESVAINSH